MVDMRCRWTIAALLLVGAAHAFAQADRDSLVRAWEIYVAGLPGTVEFESLGDGRYRLEDTDLPYDGELRLIGALVRPVETGGIETGFSTFGMVEFELTDLPADRLTSQSYYYWLADRQTLHFSDAEQRWVDPTTYHTALTEGYAGGLSFGPLSFMLSYGIWVFLIALIVFVFIAVNRQSRKARGLMDESASINQQARENLDRTQAMQDEVLDIARETRDLHAETNKILKEILLRLQR